ncbi:zinc finger protein 814-like [Formica exsecta]|uniref:zinc finger protein 814-like n=1 Tax=Formica exsecta TaxID=72781 RepID=UPI001141CE30|nr:zinc finger protein 814-like [Formica exsecta]
MEQGASFVYWIDHFINIIESVRFLASTKRLYVCHVCKIQFAKIRELTDHEQVHSVRPYRCDNCRKTYQSLVAFREHINKDHKQVLRYTCRHCSKNYTRYANYYTHLREHESFECDVCFEKFSEFCVLFEHYVTNHAEKLDEKMEEATKKRLLSTKSGLSGTSQVKIGKIITKN